MAWIKQSTRGTGQAQILDNLELDVRLVKGKGWNNFWVAFRYSNGAKLILNDAVSINQDLRKVKKAIVDGEYIEGRPAKSVYWLH